jgi:hypothetical protein
VKGLLDEWSAREPCLLYPRYRDTLQTERMVEPSGMKLIRLKNGKLEKETLPGVEEEGCVILSIYVCYKQFTF